MTACTHGMPTPASCWECMEDGNLDPPTPPRWGARGSVSWSTPTVRSVAAELGMSFGSVRSWHLPALRDAGLIAWTPGRNGTLRPLVKVVAHE